MLHALSNGLTAWCVWLHRCRTRVNWCNYIQLNAVCADVHLCELTQVPLPNRAPPLSSSLPDPLASIARLFERSASDPFYAVLAYKMTE